MAFPPIYEDVFDNSGAGPLVRPDILPEIELTGDTTGSAECGSDGKYTIATSTGSSSKLATARNIELTGDTTGSASFDGSADAVIATTTNQSAKLTTARTIELTGDTVGSVSFDGSKNVSMSTTTNASTAKKLASSISIKLTGDTTGLATTDGSSDIAIDTVTSYATKAEQLANKRTIELKGDVTGSTTFDGSADVSITTSVPVSSDWSSPRSISANTTYKPTADGYIIVSALCDSDPNWSDGVNIKLGPSSSNVTITARMLFGTHYSLGGDTCVYPVTSGMYFYMESRGNAGGSYAYFIPR